MKNWKCGVVRASAVALLVSGVLTGCQSPMWSNNKSDGRTSGRVVDDNRITAQVKADLAQEPVYKFNEVDVKTFDGVVQLSGFVNSDQQRARAGELAQEVQGVAKVVNGITIKPPQPTTPTGRPNAAPVTTNTDTTRPVPAPATTPAPAPAPISR